MSIEQFLEVVQSRATSRFEIQTDGVEIDKFKSLAPEQLLNRLVIRLRRDANEQAGWRTFLVAALESTENISMANRWAAEVRDNLIEPGSADLYLFLLIDGVSSNVGAEIESSELFCRKFVIREDESTEELLDRTFLTQVFSQTEGKSFADPLIASLAQTAEEHPWFSDQHQDVWRRTLLSGKSGGNIADDLLAQVSGEEGGQ